MRNIYGYVIGLVLSFWVISAAAQTAGLYAVQDVAANDTLNVRAGAGAGFADLGDIAYDGQVRVVGFSADGKWAKVPWADGTAWVSARFLRLIQVEGAVLPKVLHCGGTEPFWSAEITPDAISFEPMGGVSMNATIYAAVPAEGRPADFIVGILAPPMTGVLRKQICSDGMSDRDYPWSVVLMDASGIGMKVVEGCCGY